MPRITSGTITCGVSDIFAKPESRVLRLTITRGKIVQIDVVAGPERLRQIDLAVLTD
jgi:hypothetical protein